MQAVRWGADLAKGVPQDSAGATWVVRALRRQSPRDRPYPRRFLHLCVRPALAPALEPSPQVGRLQPEHGANGHERKRPAGVIAEQPLLGLVPQPLDTPPLLDQP